MLETILGVKFFLELCERYLVMLKPRHYSPLKSPDRSSGTPHTSSRTELERDSMCNRQLPMFPHDHLWHPHLLRHHIS